MPSRMEMITGHSRSEPPFSASTTNFSKSCIKYCSWAAQYPSNGRGCGALFSPSPSLFICSSIVHAHIKFVCRMILVSHSSQLTLRYFEPRSYNGGLHVYLTYIRREL